MARALLIALVALVAAGVVVVTVLLDDDGDGGLDPGSGPAFDDEVVEPPRREPGIAGVGDVAAPPAPDAPTGGVAGRVTDRGGNPVIGARVVAAPLGRRRGSGFVLTATTDPERERTATTDADGRYHVAGCDVGEIVVVASSDVHPAVIRRGVAVAADAVTTGVDFELARGRTVSGTVRDDLGAPVAGARVKLDVVTFGGDPLAARFAPRAVTDDAGRFRVEHAEARPYRAVATHDGYLPSRPVDVGEHTAEITLETTRCGRVVIIAVAAESGAPITDVELDHRGDGAFATATGAAAAAAAGTSLPDHAILVHGLTTRHLRLGVHSRGFASRVLTIRSLAPGELRRLEVALEPEVVLAGRVESQDGRGLAGAQVAVTGTPGARRDVAIERAIAGGTLEDRGEPPVVDDPRALVAERVETDERGRFRVHGLRPGDYRLSASHPEYLPARERSVTLDHDLPLEDAVIRLRRGGRVRATVTRGGVPVAGVWVVVRDPIPESRGGEQAAIIMAASMVVRGRARTDAGGAATVYAIPPGDYQAFASDAPGADPAAFELFGAAGPAVSVTAAADGVTDLTLELR